VATAEGAGGAITGADDTEQGVVKVVSRGQPEQIDIMNGLRFDNLECRMVAAIERSQMWACLRQKSHRSGVME
jgi:hypothetical protein